MMRYDEITLYNTIMYHMTLPLIGLLLDSKKQILTPDTSGHRMSSPIQWWCEKKKT